MDSHILNHLSQAQVFCIGDIMIDEFVEGDVERISPEAPVPVFKFSHARSVLGGAGNVVNTIDALKGHTKLFSFIGNDREADDLENLLGKLSFNQSFLVRQDTRKTTLKRRFTTKSQQLLRIDYESQKMISSSECLHLLQKISHELVDGNVIILSDYGKGIVTPDFTQDLIRLAHRKNCPVLVDPKGKVYDKYKGATLLTPNILELEDAIGTKLSTTQELHHAAFSLLQSLNLKGLLVTQGAKGMTLFQGTKALHFPTKAQDIYDVTGAGDTVIAALGLYLAAGGTLEPAIEFANAAAGVVVQKVGTATPSLSEIQSCLTSESRGDDHKICPSLAEAVTRVSGWHRKGLTVGLTNGCFDLLHPGHVHLLKEAKSQCDRLIVAINSDASVKRLKGPSRPILHEMDRVTLVKSLEDVDLVLVFHEDTPLQTLYQIRPDVLIKGADYELKDVVGADFIHSYGGRVHLAPLLENRSTTQTLEKIRSDG